MTQSPPHSWTERLTRIHPLLAFLGSLALVLMVADLFYHKHGYFTVENAFGFYPLCGLIAPLLIVLSARGLRPLLQRKVDSYDG